MAFIEVDTGACRYLRLAEVVSCLSCRGSGEAVMFPFCGLCHGEQCIRGRHWQSQWTQEADRAKEVSQVNATGGKKMAEQAKSQADEVLSRELQAATGEVNSQANANAEEVAFATETATLALQVQSKREAQ